MKIKNILLLACCTLLFMDPLAADNRGLPGFVKKNGTLQLQVNGESLLLLAGELGNSTSSTLSYAELAFEKCKRLGLNSVLVTVAWEQFEPKEGEFNFREIDGLIDLAEKKDLKLIVIWFGAFKNGFSSYAPEWVKTDLERFPRVLAPASRRDFSDPDSVLFNKNTLSPFFEETWKADANAFASLMKRIREKDKEQTVIMVQVENEVGTYGVVLDQQEKAKELYTSEVPGRLLQYLEHNYANLVPTMRKAFDERGHFHQGTWEEVFGELSIDAFMAWHFASFLEKLTAAGKKEYDIPMYYNAWLKKPDEDVKTGSYPTGGPIHTVLDIYKAASPSVDMLCPDIYHPAFKQYCLAYNLPGNPLFVPECRIDEAMVAKAYWVIGEMHGMGFAPFGIERVEQESSLVEGYRVLNQLMPLISERQGTDKLSVAYRQKSPTKRKVDVGEWEFDVGELEMEDSGVAEISMGEWIFKIGFTSQIKNEAAFAMIMEIDENEFLITGRNVRINEVRNLDGDSEAGFIFAKQGDFVDGVWETRRWLNGDETAHGIVLSLPTSIDVFAPENRQDIVRFKLFKYPGRNS